jgi:hypothetical protein
MSDLVILVFLYVNWARIDIKVVQQAIDFNKSFKRYFGFSLMKKYFLNGVMITVW